MPGSGEEQVDQDVDRVPQGLALGAGVLGIDDVHRELAPGHAGGTDLANDL